MFPEVKSFTATITSGQSVGNALQVGAYTIVSLQVPAAITGTALTFQGSIDGVTYTVITDPATGAPPPFPVAASKGYSIDPLILVGWRYLKVVSNAAEGAGRSFILGGYQV